MAKENTFKDSLSEKKLILFIVLTAGTYFAALYFSLESNYAIGAAVVVLIALLGFDLGIREMNSKKKEEMRDFLRKVDALLEKLPKKELNAFVNSEDYTQYKKIMKEHGIED